MENTVRTCLLIYTIIFFNTRWCSCNENSPNNSTLKCIPSERAALLNLMHNLTSFDKNVSSSWVGEECCRWRHVGCDNTTGHIIKLVLIRGDDFYDFFKAEKLDSLVYLLELKQLESLDVSFNFNFSSIPSFMGSMKQLRYLNLSYAYFFGRVPYELGNLTNLQVLDLSGNAVDADNLGWVSGLRELRYLNLNSVYMSNARDWMESLIGPLPYIRELHLSNCGLTLYKGVHKNSSLAARLPIQYLDLSGNTFSEEILPILQNLTSLEHLDLSSSITLAQSDLHDDKILQTDSRSVWGLVHNMCTLKSLDLSNNDLRGNILQPRRNLSNNCHNRYDLEELLIPASSLTGDIPEWLGENFRSLRSIDLSNNMLSGKIPTSLGKMPTLSSLDLSINMLLGEIPASLGEASTLWSLDLSNNKLLGEIPAALGKLTHLKDLDLSGNNLSSIASSLRFPINLESLILYNNQLSQILTSIGKLSKLRKLYINSNPLEGIILTESHFANLLSLTHLDITDTMLTLNLSSNWVPPFQLQEFRAHNCKINGQLPPWLQTQKNLSFLDLSNANISGLIPKWVHILQQLEVVNLSNNNLSGSPIFPINFSTIILSNNSLSGEFLSNGSKTKVYPFADTIDLSLNFIYGPLPEGLAHIMPHLTTLDLSNNQISGPIPDSLCQLNLLSILDIEHNSLTGVIPNCWNSMSSLFFVRLSYNNLKGHIPCFKTQSSYQFYLHLNDNMMSGEIPSCMSDLTYLKVVDVGGNQLSGEIPNWFEAENFKNLQILRLRDNKFSGTIPSQLCSFPHLQLMDLGYNHFTGSIPLCLSNLTAMTLPDLSSDFILSGVNEVMQGIEYAYTSTLPYLMSIDLSCNSLVGGIPDDMTKLYSLLSLNLSYNQLSGTIPENIGSLKSLISLDLSKNKLTGTIPTSMGELYSLSHLNFSYNNLSGQIPTGYQLQTLPDQALIYSGNPYLCGPFLPKECKSKVDKQDMSRSNEGKGDNKEKLERMGFDLVVMSGFATGFWVVVGTLVLNRRWRHAVFQRVEDGYYWLYDIVDVRVRVAKAKMNMR